MIYTEKEVLQFVKENDVKFIRLTFCDIYGMMKNIAIMASELPRAFSSGVPFDSSIFDNVNKHETDEFLLFPDPSTLSVLPWRPKQGRVVRFFCNITYPNGTPFEGDMRVALHNNLFNSAQKGYVFSSGAQSEFYLFKMDEQGLPTKTPYDMAGYLDISPLDKCENVRREICLALEEMDINIKSSCHKYGNGQNEIDFKFTDVMTMADNLSYFRTIVKTISAGNGLYASFMPKPLANQPSSGLTLSFRIMKDGKSIFALTDGEPTPDGKAFIDGILSKINEMSAFINTIPNSYERLEHSSVPKSIKWSTKGYDGIIKLCEGDNDKTAYIKLFTPDSACNAYVVYSLIINAGIQNILNPTSALAEFDENIETNYQNAYEKSKDSEFVRNSLPDEVMNSYLNKFKYNDFKKCTVEERNQIDDQIYFPSI